MAETAKEMALRLMHQMDAEPKANYSKGEVKSILKVISDRPEQPVTVDNDEGCRGPCEVETLRRGDVFIARLVGGKVRPWIVLSVSDGVVSAVAFSHADTAPLMVPSQCRLWRGSWIGKTISVFSEDVAKKEVTRPYTNLRHLDQIVVDIAAQYGMAVVDAPIQEQPRVVSISEIVAKMRAK